MGFTVVLLGRYPDRLRGVDGARIFFAGPIVEVGNSSNCRSVLVGPSESGTGKPSAVGHRGIRRFFRARDHHGAYRFLLWQEAGSCQ